VIELRGVTHRYANGLLALQHVDLTLPPGQFVGLVGLNGSGKSTLARHLNGLLLPSEGEVTVDGFSTRTDVYEVRQRVGMVFQNPESQLVAPLVEDDVAFGPENFAMPRDEVRARLDAALEAVGLTRERLHDPALLSGGQKQRLAIAGVLALRPRYLVLDEPTTMLDPAGRAEVMQVLGQLRAEGLTVILITHRLEELEHADRLVALEGGRVVQDGPPAEVWPRLSFAPPFLELARRLGHPEVKSEAELVEATRSLSEGKPAWVDQARAPGEALIEVSHLSHRYLAGTPFAAAALDDVTLDVREGECLGLVGTTGSGKSTLAMHLNGLLKPQEGSVKTLTRQEVGLLMQFPEHQLFEETVRAEVEFGPRNFRQGGLPERVAQALEQVGLQELDLQRSPLELSGGERRRLALASVLASRPRVLVLDEPTAGLDAVARQELLGRLKEWGLTLVVISHDLEELALLADRVAVLEHGRVKAVDTLRGLVGAELLPPPLPWRVVPGALTVEEAVSCRTG